MRKTAWILSAALALLFVACGGEHKASAPEAQAPPPATATTTSTPPAPAGPVKVMIKIAGLCTFADASVVSETAKKTVLLAKQSGHGAAFLVKRGNLDDTTGFVQMKDENGNPGEWWAYPLDGVQVELSDDTNNWDGGSAVSYSDAGDSSNDTFPDVGANGNMSSLHWIPRMSRIIGTVPTIQNAFVKKEPSKNDISLRMPLRGGTLESVLVKPYWLWQFRTNTGAYKQVQVLADQVHYSFPLKSGHEAFEVYGRPFATGGTQPGATQKLFTIKKAQNDAQIEMHLVNIPEIVAGKYPPVFEALKVGHKDPHFYMHYRMLPANTIQYEPTVIGQMKSGDSLSIETYCGPDQIP